MSALPLLWALALCSPASAQTAAQAGANAAEPNAVEQVLAEFERVPLVAIGEQHRRAEVHEFLAALLAHPRFGRAVDDIVVEFGNALYQPLADRYVAGEDVPAAELRRIWRDTGQWLVWDSPLYEQFFAHVRALNLARPPEERVRVLLGDPPIDWAKVATAADYRRFAERDAFYAEVVEREVLEKDRRGLLVVGSMHLMRRGPLDRPLPGGAGVAALLEQHAPGALHVVWTLPAAAELASKLGFERAPAYRALGDDALGAQSYGLLVPASLLVLVDGEWKPLGEAKWPPMRAVVDALLWLGPEEHSVDPAPSIYREPEYERELRRRAPILKEVYGMDFLPELEELLAKSATTSK